MTDAEFLRDLACDMADSTPIYAERLRRIADRLEKIDAQEAKFHTQAPLTLRDKP